MSIHKPVLLNEVIRLLDPQPGENFIDGTFGGGGHSRVILEKIAPDGRLLAIDWNESAIKNCGSRTADYNANCVRGNFADLPVIMRQINFPSADGLLLDLGISSDELENSGRGFSFQKDEPLLMTYSDDQKPVKEILRELTESELAEIIKKFGEERYAGKLAAAIKREGKVHPLATTRELTEVILKAVKRAGRLHPATRAFMALRIYANRELENLEGVLTNLTKIMADGGRAAIISFHSLEDRLVKNRFRQLKQADAGQIITKKPIIPTGEEISNNPRARSAKLRCFKFK